MIVVSIHRSRAHKERSSSAAWQRLCFKGSGGTGRMLVMRGNRVSSSLGRWEDEGGAPRAHRRSRAKRPSPPADADTTLYYFNVRTDVGVLKEDREGLTLPDLKAALYEALALARQRLVAGDRKGKDRRDWQIEIMDRANQHLLTVKFSEAIPVIVFDDRKAAGDRPPPPGGDE